MVAVYIIIMTSVLCAVTARDPSFHAGGQAGATGLLSNEQLKATLTSKNYALNEEHNALESIVNEIGALLAAGADQTATGSGGKKTIKKVEGWTKPPLAERTYQNDINTMVLRMLRVSGGKTRLEMNTIHKITFEPGKAKFDTPNGTTCDMYPGETENTYESTRQPDRCDIKNMRKHDLTPSDNPVPPVKRGTNLYTLWEARKSGHALSHYLCPGTTHEQLLASTDLLKALTVWTYGGEAEVKQMSINRWTGTKYDGKYDKAHKRLMYGTHLIQFMYDGKELARMEAESSNGVDIIFIEFVTAPIEANKANRNRIMSIYDAMTAIKSGTLDTLPNAFNKELLKLQNITARIPDGTLDSLKDKFKDELTREGALNFQIVGMDKIKYGVCQGNYMLPLKTIITDNFVQMVNKPKYTEAKSEATILADVVGRNGTNGDREDLTAMFTIHIYNTYNFAMYDSKADTQKDLWGQLPKTPVLDIVRALSETAKQLLVKWVNRDAR